MQYINHTKDFYLGYINNTLNLIFKKETGHPIINEQKSWASTLQNDIKMADTYILKVAQNH